MKRGYMIGVELNGEICQISHYDEKIQQAQTLNEDTPKSQIPFVIGRYNKEWVYGENARELGKEEKADCISNPMPYALKGEEVQLKDEVYNGMELVSAFFECVLKEYEKIEMIVFSIPRMDKEVVRVLKQSCEKIGISKEDIYVQDYKESFCHYMICQPRELWQHESVLFYSTSNEIKACVLRKLKEKNGRGRETFVTVDESDEIEIEELSYVYPVLNTDKAKEADRKFGELIKTVFNGKFISSVFLTGEIFEIGWFPKSLQILCEGRRVFQGNNLYSKGACYTAFLKKTGSCEYPVYWDNSKLKERICLKFRVNGMEEWYPIVSWGSRWYEEEKSFEILLENSDDFEIRVESLEQKEIEIYKVQLDQIPKRNDYSLRLRVDVTFPDEKTCRLVWTDTGFGSFFKPSGFQTETLIHIGGKNGQSNFM